ncbi:AraC family transcriptional regulator [Bacillus sp. J37]|uniref:AraC family transcriptional regulator n=1 Tax=Bacillus sp. J37 TaxID=935837 RepID=UPI00047C53C9|nr:AraC family transcriptional regulator [Bacillus sp. J37]
MNEVSLYTYTLPLIREIGHMWDDEGILDHPIRLMETLNVFIYVKKGDIQVIEDDVEFHLQSGTYLFLKKNVPHWGTKLYTPGTEWYYIHFYDSFDYINVETSGEYSKYQHSTLIMEETYLSKMTLPKTGTVKNPEYTELQLKKLCEEYLSPHTLRPLTTSSMTYQFFIDLYSKKLEESNKTKQHRIVGKMIDLFSHSSSKKLSSKEISDSIGMNYAYLSTLFRKETGKSITQFQDELLIEKAIKMLKEKSINISEVSDSLGFSNPFYFSRVFKKVTGVSPTTYLNEIYRN